MRVLVTGCSGYVGHQIASRLAARGLDVVGSSRRPLALDGVRIATGDHLDPDFVASIVSSSDAVIHLAARTRGHDARSFRHANEGMTTLFCRAARRLRKRFVYVSSDQAVSRTGFYGRSKRACEEIVARECDEDGYVILRLTAVLGRYAPDMASTFSKMIKRLHESWFVVVPGTCEYPIAPVWIGDVERVVHHLVEPEAPLGEVLELCGPVTTLESLIRLFEQRLGQRRRRVRLPLRPLQALARSLRPYRVFARLPLDALLDLGQPVAVSHEKLTRLTGFVPTAMAQAVSLIEGFPETARAPGFPAGRSP